MAAITVYVLGYSLELASLDVRTMLFWSKVEYLAIATFPNLFLMFVLKYTGLNKWLTWKNIVLLFLFPILLIIAKMTDELFHLVYSTTWVDTTGWIPLLGFTRGPIYPFALYSIFPVGLGIILLIRKRNNAYSLYRRQVSLILASIIPPLIIFIFYMGGFKPFPHLKYLDLNAFMYPLWGIGIGLAAFRYRLLDLTPIAREALIEHMGDGVFVLDEQSRLVDANPPALKIMDWTEPPIGQDCSQVFASWNDMSDVCQMAGKVDAVKVEIRHVINDETIFYDISNTPLRDGKGKNIGQLIVIHDITTLKRLEEKLLELSLIDDLTGLNNRRGFYVLADQFIQMAKRMNLKAAVIFVDMDDMKMINDTFGHAEGDRALVNIANLLRQNCRSSDILARFGGDEFVILAIESEDNGAEIMMTRFDNRMKKFNDFEGRKYPLRVSYGVAHFCLEQTCSLDELLEQADKEMYEQKQIRKRTNMASDRSEK